MNDTDRHLHGRAWTRIGEGARHVAVRLLPALIAALVLGACSTASFSSTFRASGPATHELRITVQRSALDSIGPEGIPQALSLAEDRARSSGLDVRRISSASEIGVLVSSTTEASMDAGAALNALINSLIPPEESVTVAPFAGTFGQGSPALGGNEYTLALSVDGAMVQQAILALASGASEIEPGDMDAAEVTISYAATMPGEIKQSSGTPIDRDTVRWDIPLNAVTGITAVSSVGQETPWMLVAGVTMGAAGLIALVAFGMFRLLAHRARSALSTDAPIPARAGGSASRRWPGGSATMGLHEIWDAIGEAVARAIRGGAAPGSASTDAARTTGRDADDGVDAKGD